MPDGPASAARLAPHRAARARRAFAALALAAAGLTLVVIFASAYMRHVQAGLSCIGWPACYAQLTGPGDIEGVATARSVHRVAATGVSLATIALGALAWLVPALRPLRRWALAALIVVASLAALGTITSGARLPIVAIGNLGGGFAMLAVLAGAHARAIDATAPGNAWRWALGALVLACAQAAVGGLVAAQFGLLACPTFPGCDAAWNELDAWNPLRAPDVVGSRLVAPAGAATLHLVHRANAVIVASLVLVVVAKLWHSRGELASALLVVLGAALCAGVAAALVPSALYVALAHNASAAVLVALLARAAAGRVDQPRISTAT